MFGNDNKFEEGEFGHKYMNKIEYSVVRHL